MAAESRSAPLREIPPGRRWSDSGPTAVISGRIAVRDKAPSIAGAKYPSPPAQTCTTGTKRRCLNGVRQTPETSRVVLSLAEGLVESVAGSSHGANRIALALP